ncbi:hypothetical protein [Pseudomonas asplenii]|uniref:hypothetical protein n=1 Tax=Pseudomonas asplenii TaxID=53407 RepID=UPI0006B58B0A|nr:hypothetical protein [Pseudomonas fuscovaginae]KPA96912.1 hypothetical protein PF70_03068 [Pseudomonas fuscovaginae]
MAVTLNLQHTFSTRVVYSSKEIKEMRDVVAAAIAVARVQENTKDVKEAATVRALGNYMSGIAELSDEAFVGAVIRESFKCGVADELRETLKDLNVTRMGPIQTVQVFKEAQE